MLYDDRMEDDIRSMARALIARGYMLTCESVPVTDDAVMYVVTCEAFPELSAVGFNVREVVEALQDEIEDTICERLRTGEFVPDPEYTQEEVGDWGDVDDIRSR